MSDSTFYYSPCPDLEDEEYQGTLSPSILLGLPGLVLGFVIAAVASVFAPLALGFIDYHLYSLVGVDIQYQSWFLYLVIIIWLVCVLPPLWKIIVYKTTSFEFTNKKLYYSRGVFNRSRDQLELSRIRDLATFRPFFLRLFGLGHLAIESVDRSHPELVIPGQKHVDDLKTWIHDINTSERKKLGYREFENTN